METSKLLLYLNENLCVHRNKYLDMEGINKYKFLINMLPNNGSQDIGQRRKAKLSMMKEYGVTEVEAINILNGYNINDYINKYSFMKKIDTYKQMLMNHLLLINLPNYVSSNQIEKLSEVFLQRKYDYMLTEIDESDDKELWMNNFLFNLINIKNNKNKYGNNK